MTQHLTEARNGKIRVLHLVKPRLQTLPHLESHHQRKTTIETLQLNLNSPRLRVAASGLFLERSRVCMFLFLRSLSLGRYSEEKK